VLSHYQSTSTPIERAVPAMIRAAWSMSRALRSGIFVSAIRLTCSRERRPTLFRFGSPEPLSSRSASLIRTAAGGVFVMNVKERSSKTVISTGMMRPFWSAVCALNALQNSVLAERRADRRGRVGLAAGDLELDQGENLLRHLLPQSSFFTLSKPTSTGTCRSKMLTIT
jgi:hypothetical protein